MRVQSSLYTELQGLATQNNTHAIREVRPSTPAATAARFPLWFRWFPLLVGFLLEMGSALDDSNGIPFSFSCSSANIISLMSLDSDKLLQSTSNKFLGSFTMVWDISECEVATVRSMLGSWKFLLPCGSLESLVDSGV